MSVCASVQGTMCARDSAAATIHQVDAPLTPTLYRHPHGITAIDTEYLYPGHAAAHLIEDACRAALLDVVPTSSVPYLLGALERLGIARTAFDYLLLTHVHLDHAGGAGALLRGVATARAPPRPSPATPSASRTGRSTPPTARSSRPRRCRRSSIRSSISPPSTACS